MQTKIFGTLVLEAHAPVIPAFGEGHRFRQPGLRNVTLFQCPLYLSPWYLATCAHSVTFYWVVFKYTNKMRDRWYVGNSESESVTEEAAFSRAIREGLLRQGGLSQDVPGTHGAGTAAHWYLQSGNHMSGSVLGH